ncbi:hypothetical protein T492DRAFT_1079283 [Pavlovales sp. CCMP2436]|nr:hypothetical protein T492DRAFT_1079283 [Pavlovales sp. CCMP2436]
MQARVEAGEGVYVHCNAGRGRSATAVVCYRIACYGESADEAFAAVRVKRKISNLKAFWGLRPQWRAIKAFEIELRGCHLELAKRSFEVAGARASARRCCRSIRGA